MKKLVLSLTLISVLGAKAMESEQFEPAGWEWKLSDHDQIRLALIRKSMGWWRNCSKICKQEVVAGVQDIYNKCNSLIGAQMRKCITKSIRLNHTMASDRTRLAEEGSNGPSFYLDELNGRTKASLCDYFNIQIWSRISEYAKHLTWQNVSTGYSLLQTQLQEELDTQKS